MDTKASNASLSFEPAQSVATVGTPVSVQLNIFSDTQPVISTDIWIHYDPKLVQPILPFATSPLFDKSEAKIVEPGTLYIYGIRENSAISNPANGNIGSLNFKPLKEGVVKLQFGCGLEDNQQSQIIVNNNTLNNIINCERTLAHSGTLTIQNSQILGISTDQATGKTLTMLYLTMGVALLMLFVSIYIRTKKLANAEAPTDI